MKTTEKNKKYELELGENFYQVEIYFDPHNASLKYEYNPTNSRFEQFRSGGGVGFYLKNLEEAQEIYDKVDEKYLAQRGLWDGEKQEFLSGQFSIQAVKADWFKIEDDGEQGGDWDYARILNKEFYVMGGKENDEE